MSQPGTWSNVFQYTLILIFSITTSILLLKDSQKKTKQVLKQVKRIPSLALLYRSPKISIFYVKKLGQIYNQEYQRYVVYRFCGFVSYEWPEKSYFALSKVSASENKRNLRF